MVKTELLVYTNLRKANHWQNIVNFHQDFTARTNSDYFKGQTDKGLFCWPNQGILKGEVSLYN